jgi:chloramphenicol 3-O-phosphotransferase/GrpB-like predicted nucleotidyltransferase (UPF0157 family)
VGTDIIVLNGASSSGKTSIARCLQELLPEPWLTLGVDDLIAAMPSSAPGREPTITFAPGGAVHVGPGFRQLEDAWVQGVAAMARAGAGVIVDDVFLGGGTSQARLRSGLSGLDVLWVGVRCDAAVAAAREAVRSDRVPGMAVSQAEVVHRGTVYDVEVDTTVTSALACAQVVRDRVAPSGPRPVSVRPVVVSYDPAWPGQAGALITTIGRALSPLARRVEHIGSTAVPGLAAQDVIDLQVSVDDLVAVEAGFDAALRPLGFVPSPFHQDHVPAGQVDDERRWAKRLWTRREHPEGDVNLHVRLVGSPNERFALLFRDWLRANPAAVPAYAAFKRSLAAISPGTETYAEVKDPVVYLVVLMAEPWAAAVGWPL